MRNLLYTLYVYPQLKLFQCATTKAHCRPWEFISPARAKCRTHILYNNTMQNPILSACQNVFALQLLWNIDSEQAVPFKCNEMHTILILTDLFRPRFSCHIGVTGKKCNAIKANFVFAAEIWWGRKTVQYHIWAHD